MSEKGASRKISLILILLAVAAVPLLIAGVGWAQEADPEANPQAGGPDVAVASPPDLNFTDPDGNVADMIADELGLAAVDSLVIPVADFRHDGDNVDYFYPFYEGYVYSDNDTGQYCGQAPVYLPDGAVVNSFTAYAYDNTTYAVSAWLYRKAYGSLTGPGTMASVSTPTDSTSLQTPTDITIQGATIDNSAYVYYVGTCFGLAAASTNMRLYAVQVTFTK